MANNNSNQPKRVDVKTSAATQQAQTDAPVKDSEKAPEIKEDKAAKAAETETSAPAKDNDADIAPSDKAAKAAAVAKAKAPIVKAPPIMQVKLGDRKIRLPQAKIIFSGKTIKVQFNHTRKIEGTVYTPGIHSIPAELLGLRFVKGLQHRGDITVIA